MPKAKQTWFKIDRVGKELYYYDCEQQQLFKTKHLDTMLTSLPIAAVVPIISDKLPNNLGSWIIVNHILLRLLVIGLAYFVMRQAAILLSDTQRKKAGLKPASLDQKQLSALLHSGRRLQKFIQFFRYLILLALLILAVVLTMKAVLSVLLSFMAFTFVYEDLTYNHPTKVKDEIFRQMEAELSST